MSSTGSALANSDDRVAAAALARGGRRAPRTMRRRCMRKLAKVRQQETVAQLSSQSFASALLDCTYDRAIESADNPAVVGEGNTCLSWMEEELYQEFELAVQGWEERGVFTIKSGDISEVKWSRRAEAGSCDAQSVDDATISPPMLGASASCLSTTAEWHEKQRAEHGDQEKHYDQVAETLTAHRCYYRMKTRGSACHVKVCPARANHAKT